MSSEWPVDPTFSGAAGKECRGQTTVDSYYFVVNNKMIVAETAARG
jgi:hypothetical protein